VDLRKHTVAAISTALLLSACSFESESLWPTIGSDDSAGAKRTAERISIPPSQAERNAQPTISASTPAQPTSVQAAAPQQVSAPLTPQPTGTVVGQKVGQLRGELDRLRNQLVDQNARLQQIRQATTQNAQRYHGTVAAITARLQLGTTPGNPVLVNQWNAAQGELDNVSTGIAGMNTLANEIAANSSLANYVLEASRAAYGLTGAVDEDHRQLALLEDETNRAVVLIDRLLGEVNEDVARQTAYIANERSNLTTLAAAIKNGELHGTSLMARAYSVATPPMAFSTSSTPRSGFSPGGRQPLVVIRFDRPDVSYQQALYTAVSKTLEARPDASFDLVGVMPAGGDASSVALNQSRSKKYSNDVLKALIDMGMPASRVSLASASSASATTNEVHLYIR
jgi:hypothetical protein